jgi:hypothetical protein
MSMADRYALVVNLWVHKGQEAAFEAYEREAARIMARHKGRIDQAVRVTPLDGAPADAACPYEVHFVSFPDKAHWQAYRADPGTVALAGRRAKIVSRTAMMEGREAGPY